MCGRPPRPIRAAGRLSRWRCDRPRSRPVPCPGSHSPWTTSFTSGSLPFLKVNGSRDRTSAGTGAGGRDVTGRCPRGAVPDPRGRHRA